MAFFDNESVRIIQKEQLADYDAGLVEGYRKWGSLTSMVAERIQHAIDKTGCTQKEIATRLNISQQYLSDIVRGRRAVSAFVAVRLETVLGIDALKVMTDQTFDELRKARQEYAIRQKREGA